MKTSDDDDPVMEWSLRERLGGEQPPDLVAAVRRRLGEAPPVDRPVRRSLVAAALVLLGAAVVVGVAYQASRGGENREATGPQGPMPSVRTVGDVAALPLATREVEVIGGDDHVIEALTALRGLEVLVVREPWNESFGLSLKMQPGLLECPVTNVSWQHVAKLTKLRRLEFSGTRLVGRASGDAGADTITALERLPLLESLSLRFMNTSNEVLARLPKLRHLRHLDLSFNHGFTEEGLQAVGACRSLRTLSLRGCQQLHDRWMADMLTRLQDLERLDLSAIDGINWWSGTGGVDEVDSDVMTKARGWADALNASVQGQTLAAVAKLPRLRVLEIGGGFWSHADLHALEGCQTLEELGMASGRGTGSGFVVHLPRTLRRLDVCGDFTDEFCAAVRGHLVNLRQLSIAACDQITDAGLRELLTMPSLRVLDLRQMRGLTAACVDSLAAASQLESLDLRHCPFVQREHVDQLRRALPGVRIEATVPDESPR